MILGPDNPRFPIGISDYRELRKGGFTYIDKTHFVAEVLRTYTKAILIPRPRRFGKTLNLTTLRYFVEKREEDLTDIFEDTFVWQTEGGRYQAHFQKYPVIWLSFREIKQDSWEKAWPAIRELVQTEFERLWVAHTLERLCTPRECRRVAQLLADDAAPHSVQLALELLIDLLARSEVARAKVAQRQASHEDPPRPVLLIDEYDAPLHTAYEYGYWPEATKFFRSLYAGGRKDSALLSFGVLTGILRIVKASSYSGLNNTDDYNLFHEAMPDAFGLTEQEVDALVAQTRATGAVVDADGMRRWYNGYQFGSPLRTIYNPWSVLKYLAHPRNGLRSHWKHSSDNAMVRDQLVGRLDELGPEVQTLMAGGTVTAIVQDNILLDELEHRRPLVWSLLTFTGYLTAASTQDTDNGRLAELRIPNQEVAGVFRDVFSLYLEGGSVGEDGLKGLTDAILSGNGELFELLLEEVLKTTMSYFDFGVPQGEDGHKQIEAVYQAFIVGLLLHLQPTHQILSNREAAFGRADVMIVPRAQGDLGAVLELKVVKSRIDPSAEAAMQRAVQQLRDKAYADQVRAGGAGKVHTYAVVFDGKRCWVEVVDEV